MAIESEVALGEDVWGELESGLHVSLDLEFSLHESGLGVELTVEKGNGIAVEHSEGGVSLALLALLDGSVTILEIDGPEGGWLSLGGGDFHVVGKADFLDGFSSLGGEVGLDFVEDGSELHK